VCLGLLARRGLLGDHAYVPGEHRHGVQALAAGQAGLGHDAHGTLHPAQLVGPDLYFDSICRVDIDPWSHGRIILVGDAACGATIGGMGTGTAIVAAYVLAGELAAAHSDHTVAASRYEHLLRDFARRCQKGGDATGSSSPHAAPGESGSATVYSTGDSS
jgi:2-polyprenyl-6-methoxyphenol hydroxylase-like FAD-dependent oxidoreductase